MKSGLATSGRLIVAAAFVLPFAGCDSSDTTTRPPVVVVTPEPVRGILAQTSFENFSPDVWVSIELLLTQKGVLDVTTDWTFPDTWMYVYFGNTNCTYAQLSSRSCPFLISSETKNPKPRVIYTQSLDPGTYYLVLYNAPYDRATGTGGFGTESVSLQIGLTIYPFTQAPGGGVSIVRRQALGPAH